MRASSLVAFPLLGIASALLAGAIALGCGSTPAPTPSSPQDASTDGNATTDGNAITDGDHDADGPHDGGAPDALYGACAIQGSFGWPCSAADSGPDPTDCTYSSYPECFIGGQGSWCTKTCATAVDCTTGVEDAGCVPTACNARGYCK